MLGDITFGQYFPGSSLLHRADPRTKLIFAVFYVVVLFFCKSAASFAFALVYTAVLIALSGLPARAVLRSVKPLLFVILFTAVIYRGGEGRTKLKVLKFGAPDALCAVFAAVFLCGILLCNIFLPYITI